MLYSTHLLRHLRFTIGQNIHRLRAQRAMTISKLSAASGVAEDLIERYEIGKGDVQLHEVLKVACALSVTTDSLLR